jgi:hypothetical protein
MKLIVEQCDNISGFIEVNEAAGKAEKNYYIQGIFSTPGVKNRNGRIYPLEIWQREVQKYQTELANNSINTLGEYQHPPRATVDPMEAVIRIVELKMTDDNKVWGKAKILNDNSPKTNKLKALIDEGYQIGVSTRGVGKLGYAGTVEQFNFITVDVVDMPSDYNAMLTGVNEGFINGVLEQKEFDLNESGCIVECSLKQESKEGTIYKNVAVLKEILDEKGVEKLCDVSIEEKEDILTKFLEKCTIYKNEEPTEEPSNESESTIYKNEDDAKKILEALSKFKRL